MVFIFLFKYVALPGSLLTLAFPVLRVDTCYIFHKKKYSSPPAPPQVVLGLL